MNLLRIAICDDSTEQIKLIKTVLLCYLETITEQPYEIQEYNNSFLFVEELSKNAGFDIVLLDICMPGILGTDIARIIRKRKDKTEIIFLTNSDEFAVDAFALKAAHYLMKPFTKKQFDEAMNRAMERFEMLLPKRICLKLEKGNIQTIDINEILFIESFDHAQSVYLKSGEQIETRESLSQLFSELEKLSNGQFIAPYRGYIVNQNAIRSMETDEIVLRNGKTVPIIKRNFREIRKNYFNYMFGEGTVNE